MGFRWFDERHLFTSKIAVGFVKDALLQHRPFDCANVPTRRDIFPKGQLILIFSCESLASLNHTNISYSLSLLIMGKQKNLRTQCGVYAQVKVQLRH